MTIGWRRNPSAPQADPAVIEALRTIPVALLSDNMGRSTGSYGLVTYHKPRQLVGTAVTVKTRPGDNLAVHRAFEFCRPGDVMVVDAGADVSQAIIGEIMTTYAESIGIAGIVLDGALRDVAAIRAHDYPVYARGHTHRGPYKSGPGDVNVIVSVGGMVVSPGDIVIGDADGLLAIASAEAAGVIEKAQAQGRKETAILQSISDGRFDRTWIDAQEAKMQG